MRIELLYFDECPNWQATLNELRSVLQELHLPEEVHVVRVESEQDAKRVRFLGSPSVRVNGKDVERGAPEGDYGLRCRVYWVGGRARGAPPREWMVTALTGGTG